MDSILKIKPVQACYSECIYCQNPLASEGLFWQGMHVCKKLYCSKCKTKFVDSLEVGHSVGTFYRIDINQNTLFGDDKGTDILTGGSLLESLGSPQLEDLEIAKEIFKQCDRVIILNCVDYLYGHCLLKLLNAQQHLENNSEYGLIIIIQKFLRWLVPDGVAEIWTVNLPLQNGRTYYPKFHEFVSREVDRFSEVYLSRAYSHPSQFNISQFTKVSLHDFHATNYRITYIWREDRTWTYSIVVRAIRKVGFKKLFLSFENWKVCRFLSHLRSKFPGAKFTVAGLGITTNFPSWINDERVNVFSEQLESKLCQIYSESRLVVGVHGSNMLLPSAHAGMTIDLMPDDRLGNFAQDILYQEKNPRLASFRYRYISLTSSAREVATVASSMLIKYQEFYSLMSR